MAKQDNNFKKYFFKIFTPHCFAIQVEVVETVVEVVSDGQDLV